MAKDNFTISVHHIGGRCGTRVFPKLPAEYEKDLENVLYEADTSCISQMESQTKHLASQQVILPYCIAGHTGKADFHLLADRYESTLEKPNVDNARYYFNGFGWDHDLRGVIDEICQVEVITLDDLYSNPSAKAALPDFLSIDTEGTEPGILNGAKNILKTKLLMVQCEFDLDNTQSKLQHITREYGFRTAEVQLANSTHTSYKPVPIGLRGAKGNSPIFGEILFYKNPKYIVANHPDPKLDLLKAAFIAFVQFHIQDAFEYLWEFETMSNSKEYLQQVQDKKTYLKFLNLFMGISASYPNIVPLKYSTIFPTPEMRKNRFANSVIPSSEELKKSYFQYVDRKELKGFIPQLFSENYIGIEQLCLQCGFKEHADAIRKQRLQDIVRSLGMLGLVVREKDTYKLSMETFNNL